jgi:predicted nucleotidyltransferase
MTHEPNPRAEDPFVVAIAAQLAAAPGVAGVALGGSRARERARRDSDWDFALYVDASFQVDRMRELARSAGWSGHVAERGE